MATYEPRSITHQGYEVIEKLGENRMVLSVGPHHPSTHGVLRLILELEGETVLKCTPEIGFLHTGIEKTAENLTWQQAITVIDRMDYLSPLSNNLGYVMAVEKLLDLEIPERAVTARLLLSELMRLASHLVWLGTTGLDFGVQSMIMYAFDMREGILDMFEEISGARMNPSYFRVGGLANDLTPKFDQMLRDWLSKFPKGYKEMRNVLEENPIFLDRTKGIGAISKADAVAWGLTGPNLRASGVDYDVRKAFPYMGYETYNFTVPLGTTGDTFDRYLVRVEEMWQSYNLVLQALERLPEGPWQSEDRKIVRPPKHEVRESMEQLIHHFKIVSYGFDVPAGEVYVPIESPRGEYGVYLVSNGGNKPWRVRTRPPSFYNVMAVPKMLEGYQIADLVSVVATVDPVFGEVDR